MQDRYAGDAGDFLKLGLLRWLFGPIAGATDLRLGIVWYRVENERHNEDGRHTAYLSPNNSAASELRDLDLDLYLRLAPVAHSEPRNVATLEASGALPPQTRTFSETLNLRDLPPYDHASRSTRREDWLNRALVETVDCDVIFVDPDNGLGPPTAVIPHTNKSVKHAYLSELARFAVRGQSIIAYQHCGRHGTAEQQARRWLRDFGVLPPTRSLAAVHGSLGTARIFLIAAAPAHTDLLAARLRDLSSGRWGHRRLAVQWTLDDIDAG